LPPSAYTSDELDFIVHRVLELTYTAWDLKPFAEDLDYDGPPFRWDEDRRALLRAELDAYYAALYGLTRDELRYVLDPQDVYGPDFPGETFRVLKEREIRQLGEYRTRRLVLEAWDRLDLAPRNRDGRYDSGPPSGAVNGVAPRKAETAPAARSLPTESAQILSHQTVRERSRTPARAMPLLPSSSAPSPAPQTTPPAMPTTRQPSDGETDGRPPSPPGQAALPGFSGGTAELRQRVLKHALEALRRSGALTGREIAGRLANIDRRIDRHLVNSVPSREGAAFVAHNVSSGKYTAKTR